MTEGLKKGERELATRLLELKRIVVAEWDLLVFGVPALTLGIFFMWQGWQAAVRTYAIDPGFITTVVGLYLLVVVTPLALTLLFVRKLMRLMR